MRARSLARAGENGNNILGKMKILSLGWNSAVTGDSGQSGFLRPLHFRLAFLSLFSLEQFRFGHREHLAHGVVETLEFRFAGNIRCGQRFHLLVHLFGGTLQRQEIDAVLIIGIVESQALRWSSDGKEPNILRYFCSKIGIPRKNPLRAFCEFISANGVKSEPQEVLVEAGLPENIASFMLSWQHVPLGSLPLGFAI